MSTDAQSATLARPTERRHTSLRNYKDLLSPAKTAVRSSLVTARMCGAFQLSVPLEVSFGTGRSWEEAGH